MQLTFLSAADGTRLTKTIVRDPDTGALGISSYPMVGRFNSASIDCPDLSAAYFALSEAASNGACLLKGSLTSALHNESRAGKTNPTAVTDYLVLDLDFAEGFSDIDDFLTQLDPALSGAAYIFQHSTSAGIKGHAGLRGHVFIRLAEPTPPSIIKTWLMDRNLTVPALRKQTRLAASGQALHWPLDVTTCQNDKLIYLAPPILMGLDDPIPERFVLRPGNEAVHPNFNALPQVVRDSTENRVRELRKEAGLNTRRRSSTRIINGEEVLLNPDQAVVTGVRQARGYTYLNLNGGDSWGYYFPNDRPELLYNFKGEPIVRLVDIAPDFYRQLVKTDGSRPVQPLIFRDFSTDTYYNGVYCPDTETLILSQTSSKQKLDDFAANHDIVLPDPIPDWTYVFDPTRLDIVDFDNRWANKFVPTPFLRDTTTACDTLPPVTARVIHSVCGDNQETVDHFLNWLAFIFQTRQKTKTAWIFHGTNGTGKGILLSSVLMPLFGHRYVQAFTTSNMEDTFNANLEECLIQWLDEFHLDDSKGKAPLLNKIKNLITEDVVLIRAMRRNGVQRQVYNNLIIATNHPDPYPLDERDRRFNIAPAQNRPIDISQDDIDAIATELPFTAAFLRDYAVDGARAQRILVNEARKEMIAAAENSVDRFFRNLARGDLDFFLQFKRERPPIVPDNAYIEFERAIKRWAANVGTQIVVPRDEAAAVYAYLQNQRISPNKFTSMCTLHHLKIRPHRVGGVTERGFYITFTTADPETVNAYLQTNNVIPMSAHG